MKFLVDQNRSPLVAEALRRAGHDAVHTIELGLERASDVELFERAAREGRVIVSGDTAYAAILAQRSTPEPSEIPLPLRCRLRA